MRGKALKARRQRNTELMARDAANRCAKCKRALEVPWVTDTFGGRRYCSVDCMTDYLMTAEREKPR